MRTVRTTRLFAVVLIARINFAKFFDSVQFSEKLTFYENGSQMKLLEERVHCIRIAY